MNLHNETHMSGCWITVKFGKWLGSSSTEPPAKFHSNNIIVASQDKTSGEIVVKFGKWLCSTAAEPHAKFHSNIDIQTFNYIALKLSNISR